MLLFCLETSAASYCSDYKIQTPSNGGQGWLADLPAHWLPHPTFSSAATWVSLPFLKHTEPCTCQSLRLFLLCLLRAGPIPLRLPGPPLPLSSVAGTAVLLAPSARMEAAQGGALAGLVHCTPTAVNRVCLVSSKHSINILYEFLYDNVFLVLLYLPPRPEY